VERTKRHPLLVIVGIALCAVICGADSWVEVAEFGRVRQGWLSSWLDLAAGIPSHDTFGRVFAAVDPLAFASCFASWVRAVAQAPAGQVVAVAGKVARGSHDRRAGRTALDLVSAWASSKRLGLAQVAVAEGSNEIPAIPAWRQLLALAGCILTVGAMGCQTASAGTIREQGAAYLLALKENQEPRYQALTEAFAALAASGGAAYRHDLYREVDKDHGRLEGRATTVITAPEWLAWLHPDQAWAGLAGLAQVVAERHIDGPCSRDTRYYLTSLTTVRSVHAAVRRPWGIENRVHWVLDMAFREDLCRVRCGHGAHHFSLLRRLALNLFRQDPAPRCGIKARRLIAALDSAYLLNVLNGSF
jgi:predicted transposase YbfD/YdcC